MEGEDSPMESEDNGEHSRRTRGSEGGGDGERPFKKARYVWQLKGKYHLRPVSSEARTAVGDDSDCESDSANNNNRTVCPRRFRIDDLLPDDVAPDEEEDNSDDSETDGLNNNNGRTVYSSSCCIGDLLTKSDALMDKLLDDERTAEGGEVPLTLVKPNVKNRDEFLQKWQDIQVAKSFIDNTINSILEHWKIAPFDAADFVENCEKDDQVEDEGILMAIQSHGLQSTAIRPPDSNRRQTETLTNLRITASDLDNLENVNVERIKSENSEAQDSMDFLNTAVSVAIQKKGLSSYKYG